MMESEEAQSENFESEDNHPQIVVSKGNKDGDDGPVHSIDDSNRDSNQGYVNLENLDDADSLHTE